MNSFHKELCLQRLASAALGKSKARTYFTLIFPSLRRLFKMHPTYVYSRRVNGARAKKARSSASIAAKSTPRRSPNFHLCNSDDGTFSPEGYTSSASSTSSFAFPKHSASFSPSDFPRPSTSSSRGDRLTPFGGSQVTASSREVTPALAPAQQRQLQPYPSVLLRPEGFHNPISRGSRSPGLPQHEAQSTHSPNVAQGVDSFKSPSPRPRSEVSMKGRAGWPKELSATIATSQPLCPMADSTSPMTNSAYFQLDQHDCGQINHAFPPKSRCSSSPSLPSSSFDSPLPVLRPGTASIFGPYYHERDAQPVTGTGLTAAHCRAISSGTVHNGHSLGHILQGSGVYAQESQVDTAPSSSDAWSLGPTTTTIPYLNHGQSISTHAGPHQGHLFEPTAPPLQAAPESEAGSHH